MVEPQIVVLDVAGSSPVDHPSLSVDGEPAGEPPALHFICRFT